MVEYQCWFLAAAAKSLQSCPTLSDPMDCSLPGSSIHGIFQARVLEWGAIAFSNVNIKCYQKKRTLLDILILCFSILILIYIDAGSDIFWRRQWHPTPVLLSGKSHGRRSLVGCSPWGREESDTTERLHFLFSRSCVGEGNGNPLQCSCLENPRDGGASWAAVYGVTESRTQLKRLSSSSSKGI